MEALKRLKTVSEIAAENGVHPVQVTQWKREMQEGAAQLFERKSKAKSPGAESQEVEKARLERKVGQLVVEVDWLQKKVQGVGDRSMRKTIVDTAHLQLSVRKQCHLLGINHNRLKPPLPKLAEADYQLMRCMDEIALRFHEFGSRRMRDVLRRRGHRVSRSKVPRLMQLMGLEAIYQRSRTSQPGDAAKGHRIYLYLLRDRPVEKPDEVWCADITYIPMPRGFAYLVAVMDWRSRAVLSWRLSNTLESGFCVEAFRDALRATGRAPAIFNTD